MSQWLCCRFISKYHPKNITQSKELEVSNLQSRLRAFLFLLESGLVGSVSVSLDSQDDVVKVMDSGRSNVCGVSAVATVHVMQDPTISHIKYFANHI